MMNNGAGTPAKSLRPDNLNPDDLVNGCSETLRGINDPGRKKLGFVVRMVTDPGDASPWWMALSKCVTLINSSHTELLQVVWDYDWDRSDADIRAYSEFLTHLITAHGVRFLIPTLQSLVKAFVPRSNLDPKTHLPVLLADPEATARVSQRVHACLRQLLWKVPSIRNKLAEIFEDQFPYFPHPLASLQSFSQNLFEFLEYCPPLQERCLNLFFNRIIALDCSINLEEVPDDDEGQAAFSMELENTNNEVIERHRENAAKLDVLIDLFITYVNNRRTEQDMDNLFAIILRIFDATILSTHKSKYTQFIIFYMCKLKESYASQFLDHLLGKLLKLQTTPTVIVHSSIAYIGSFVGRASFIPVEKVLEVLGKLVPWLTEYVNYNLYENPDAQKHALFYAMCQSVLYIMCFKQHLLRALPNGSQIIEQFQFNRILESSLNPLKLILPQIAQEFVKIFKRMGDYTPKSIFEMNKKLILPTFSIYGGKNEIETFFPFDPFLLRNSSRHFKGSYQIWHTKKSAEVVEDEEEDDCSDCSSESESPRTRRRGNSIGMAISFPDNSPDFFNYSGSFSHSMETHHFFEERNMGSLELEF